MAEQHGTQSEHHADQTELEFFERARERLNRSLQQIAEIEDRMARNLSGGSAQQRRRDDRVEGPGSTA